MFAEELLEPEVLARFDIVGFDPRGIGASDPIQCFATDAEAEALLSRMTGVPVTDEQIRETLRASWLYTEGCKRNVGPLLTHMSTLNVAKDLDLLRAAVGDQRLTYAGFSYGTLIGAAHPTFGRAEAFGEVGCANWPRAEERYAGPWHRRTARTVLVA